MWGPAGLNFGAGVVPYLHKRRETSEFVLDVYMSALINLILLIL